MEEIGNLNPENAKETDLLSWKSLEFFDYSRNWKWFAATGLGFLLVIAYSIYTGDWFIVGITVILAATMYWYQTKKPSEQEIRITQLGVYINKQFYPYNEIHSFWMHLKSEPRKLNIIFRKNYLPQLSILLHDLDPLQVRTVLSKFVPEQTDRTESIIDKLSRFLRL